MDLEDWHGFEGEDDAMLEAPSTPPGSHSSVAGSHLSRRQSSSWASAGEQPRALKRPLNPSSSPSLRVQQRRTTEYDDGQGGPGFFRSHDPPVAPSISRSRDIPAGPRFSRGRDTPAVVSLSRSRGTHTRSRPGPQAGASFSPSGVNNALNWISPSVANQMHRSQGARVSHWAGEGHLRDAVTKVRGACMIHLLTGDHMLSTHPAAYCPEHSRSAGLIKTTKHSVALPPHSFCFRCYLPFQWSGIHKGSTGKAECDYQDLTPPVFWLTYTETLPELHKEIWDVFQPSDDQGSISFIKGNDEERKRYFAWLMQKDGGEELHNMYRVFLHLFKRAGQ